MGAAVVPAVEDQGLDQAAASATSGASEDDVQAGMEKILAEFNQELSKSPRVDEEAKKTASEAFTRALKEAASQPSSSRFDEAAWLEMVDALQMQGELSNNEASNLIRQLNDALQPLKNPETELALEFGRRLSADGQERAMAWFREESKKLSGKSEEAAQASSKNKGFPTDIPNQLQSEITTSRSRRLRGPPTRR